MMFKYLFSSLFLLGILFACQPSDYSNAAAHLDPVIEKRVDSLLRLMTLEEKVGQMNQYQGSRVLVSPSLNADSQMKIEHIKKGWVGSMLNVSGSTVTRKLQEYAINESRLGIPMLFAFDLVHGYKTMLPLPLAEAASWDLEAIKESARIAGVEAASAGVHWTLAPSVDLHRDARWGKVMEGGGEDPYLAAAIAGARVRGFQGEDLLAKNTIAASAKYLAASSSPETSKTISEEYVENITLPPFKAAVNAGVATVMSGLSFPEKTDFLANTLRGEWGFSGLVVSSAGTLGNLVERGGATDRRQAIGMEINAGFDVDTESAYIRELMELVKAGVVKERAIDQAVRRILRLKFQLGLFDDPYRYCNPAAEKQDLMHRDHLEKAREIAKKSIVLLKNESNLLPIPKATKTIAVIGPLANDRDSPLGSWRASATRNSAISLWEGIRETASPDTRLIYARGCKLAVGKRGASRGVDINDSDRSGFPEAIAAARQADVVIVALGEDCWQTGKEQNQESIGLLGLQEELLQEIHKVNDKVVLVLMNGRPITFNWAADHVPAIVEAWHLGHMAGLAISDVLWGEYNPAGKLPMSFPADVEQCPIYYNHLNTVAQGEPKYPFGFGLSYTNFSYSVPVISSSEIRSNDSLEVAVTVTNTGELAGEEVVQMYIQDKVSSSARPVKALKGFKKISLAPGDSETVNFTIQAEDLAYYTSKGNWEIEPGAFVVSIGSNARDVQEVSFEYIAE